MSTAQQKQQNPSRREKGTSSLRTGFSQDLAAPVFLEGRYAFLLVLIGALAVALIGWVDYYTGPDFSFSIFFFVVVAIGAWQGGLGPGILLALACTVCWQLVENLERTPSLPVIHLWNGVSRFGIFVITASLLSRLRRSLFQEKRLARSDPLTGAANGRTFYESVSLATAWSLRTARPLTLVYLDMDNFKLLNDTKGHARGDEALCDLAQTIQENIRGTDMLARLGGDEFGLLLSDCDGEGAKIILEKLRKRFAEGMEAKHWPITLSIGAMTYMKPLRDVDAMVQHADGLMYAAKHGGKNRIVHHVMHGLERGPEEGAKVERRTAARIICNRRARVRPEGQAENVDEFARVYDISPSGLCLRLEKQLPDQTLLAIEPLHECGAKTLLVRVIFAVRQGDGWLHECVFPNPLSEEQLALWLMEQAAEAQHQPSHQ